MTAIGTWIVLGAAIGLVASIRSPERFPAGWPGAIAGGAAGAFVGGGLVTILASQETAGVDLDRLAPAARSQQPSSPRFGTRSVQSQEHGDAAWAPPTRPVPAPRVPGAPI